MRNGKTHVIFGLGIVAVFGIRPACSQEAEVNLFKNPGFESSQDWWQFDQSFGTATGTIAFDDPMAVHEGIKGASVIVTAVDEENWHVQLQCPPQFEAFKDFTYHLTFFARTKSPDGKSIHVAIQDGAPDYGYRSGVDFRLDTAWQKIEVNRVSDVEGLEALRFNIYVGSDTGTYYFDNFSLTSTAPISSGILDRKANMKNQGRKVDAPIAADVLGRSGRTSPYRLNLFLR